MKGTLREDQYTYVLSANSRKTAEYLNEQLFQLLIN